MKYLLLFLFLPLFCSANQTKLTIRVYESNGPLVEEGQATTSNSFYNQLSLVNASLDAKSNRITLFKEATLNLSDLVKANKEVKLEDFITPPPGLQELYGVLPVKAGLIASFDNLLSEPFTPVVDLTYKYPLQWMWGRNSPATPVFNDVTKSEKLILSVQQSWIFYSIIPTSVKESKNSTPLTLPTNERNKAKFLTIIISYVY